MTNPLAVDAALRHVRQYHPEVDRVTFAYRDEDCGGFWIYQGAKGEKPSFVPEVNVSLLEDAIDAAYEDGREWPATYYWESMS